MLPADLRIGGADVVVTRNVARSYRIDITDAAGAPVPVGSVAWWVGGTADGGDNQGDAAEYAAAPVAGDPPSASWTLSVPALTGTRVQRLRWVINGKVAAVGSLSAQRDGRPSPADTIAVVVDEAHIALRLEGLPGGGGQVDSVGAGTGIDVDASTPTAPVVSLNSAALVSLGKADSALQPDDGLVALDSAAASKLGGIEAGADVTDATNVAAAGAIMQSPDDDNTALRVWAGVESDLPAEPRDANTLYFTVED